jgi:hypothetical protein
MRARVIRPAFGESRFVIGLSATTLFLFFAWTISKRRSKNRPRHAVRTADAAEEK